MLGRKHSLKGTEQIVLADYGPDEFLNMENQDLEWVNKVRHSNKSEKWKKNELFKKFPQFSSSAPDY